MNTQTADGQTALDYALRNGDTQVVATLRKAGGESNAKSASLTVAAEARKFDPAALDRTFPLLRRADEGFLRQSGCVSCRNNSLFAMTVKTARRTWVAERSNRTPQGIEKTIGPYIEAWRDRALQGVGIPGDPIPSVTSLSVWRQPSDPLRAG